MLLPSVIFGMLLISQAQGPAPTEEPTTLHAYTNLVQIPVLVVTNKHLRAAPLSPDQFSLSIDSGPRFAPRHVRQERDDPIYLDILLDVSPSTRAEIQAFERELRQVRNSFGPADMLSVSLQSGASLAHTEAVPVLERMDPLMKAVDTMIAGVSFPDASVGAASAPSAKPLWDAVALTLRRFGDTRSRRVLLVVTDGDDQGSHSKLQQLHYLADSLGVTIFGLRNRSESAARSDEYVLNRDSFSYARPRSEGADGLVTLTEESGGMTLETRNHPLAEGISRILRLVRERYLVDFVRPTKLPSGTHTVDVRIRQKNLFVRWSGTRVPLEDPKIANDPSTVPADRSREPPVGTRRVLTR